MCTSGAHFVLIPRDVSCLCANTCVVCAYNIQILLLSQVSVILFDIIHICTVLCVMYIAQYTICMLYVNVYKFCSF